MQSLYARYLDERTDDEIIETDSGFITYRRLNANQMYIIDLYILPEVRNHGVARELADRVTVIAKSLGCKEILGTVIPSCRKATESMMVLIAYGMNVSSSSDNCIIFKKDI